ncbi:hypothetical protein [Terricaulis silvestris]|uniref:Uncharacterized protein n=1 Tax=Terricaulis silvestris TaxID=2686094 RepID=A0A6I6MT99_9CAUL|nr:hypothetical protein [Terricaulis silvestris]QGZ95997.1 hypothetical protein DSM104635_02853 [Terricaulis silvestris]
MALIKISGIGKAVVTNNTSVGYPTLLEATDVQELHADRNISVGLEALRELRNGRGFLSDTSDTELVALVRALDGKAEDDRTAILKATPLWERWLQNGGNAASIAALLTQLALLIP